MKNERNIGEGSDVIPQPQETGVVTPPEAVVAPPEKGGKLSAEEKLAALEQGIKDRETKKRGRKKKMAEDVVDMEEGNKKLAEKVKTISKKPGFESAVESETKGLRAQQAKLEQEAEDLSKRAKEIKIKVGRLRGNVTRGEEKDLDEALAGVEEMENEVAVKKSNAEGIKYQISDIANRHREVEIQQQVTGYNAEEFAIDQVALANDPERFNAGIEVPEDEKKELGRDVKVEETRRKEEGWAEDAHRVLSEFSEKSEKEFPEAVAQFEQILKTLNFEGGAGQQLSAKIEAVKQADSKLKQAEGAFLFRDKKLAKAYEVETAAKNILAEALNGLMQEIRNASQYRIKTDKGRYSTRMFGYDMSKGAISPAEADRSIAYIKDTVSSGSSDYDKKLGQTLQNPEIANTIEQERAKVVSEAKVKIADVSQREQQARGILQKIATECGIRVE
ncbi:MAG: hypothetical protein NTW11_01290 [Candidatus Staskawiczbacteria bacterium]|nr:hypothetical protein [Candidatus Staskawiczbacteria bacterium]